MESNKYRNIALTIIILLLVILVLQNYFTSCNLNKQFVQEEPSPTTTTTPTIPLEGLIAYYPFNGNANDEIGNGNNGIIHNKLSIAEDRFNKSNAAYRFNNHQDEILFPDSILNLGRDNYSINGWFKVEDSSGTEQLIIHTLLPYEEKQAGIGITINYEGSGNHLVYFLGQDWNVALRSTGNLAAEFGKWHMFTLVKQGDNYSHYLDGQIDKRHSSNHNLDSRWVGFRIGSIDPRSTNPHSFRGILDDYSFYNRALTEPEIKGMAANR